MKSRRLVTVATFDLPPLAHLARESLEGAGIQAVVADDQMVGMDWLLSIAVGGVKVQVWEEDAERAVAVLEEDAHHPPDLETEPGPIAEEVEESDNGYEPTEADFADEPEPVVGTVLPDPEVVRTSRDGFAKRSVFAGLLATLFVYPAWDAIYYEDSATGCFGVFIVPTAIYSLYLVANAATGPGTLSRRGRNHLWLGILLAATPLMFCLGLLVSPFLR